MLTLLCTLDLDISKPWPTVGEGQVAVEDALWLADPAACTPSPAPDNVRFGGGGRRVHTTDSEVVVESWDGTAWGEVTRIASDDAPIATIQGDTLAVLTPESLTVWREGTSGWTEELFRALPSEPLRPTRLAMAHDRVALVSDGTVRSWARASDGTWTEALSILVDGLWRPGAVAMHRDRLLVGPADATVGYYGDGARLHEWDGASWQVARVFPLTTTMRGPGIVALWGTTAVVGDQSTPYGRTQVDVWSEDGAGWTLQAQRVIDWSYAASVRGTVLAVTTWYDWGYDIERSLAVYQLPTNDQDGDGHDTSVDCDDLDPATGPGSPEVANGRDDDCDERVDEDIVVQPPTGDTGTPAPARTGCGCDSAPSAGWLGWILVWLAGRGTMRACRRSPPSRPGPPTTPPRRGRRPSRAPVPSGTRSSGPSDAAARPTSTKPTTRRSTATSR